MSHEKKGYMRLGDRKVSSLFVFFCKGKFGCEKLKVDGMENWIKLNSQFNLGRSWCC